jgi:hypothetical protein
VGVAFPPWWMADNLRADSLIKRTTDRTLIKNLLTKNCVIVKNHDEFATTIPDKRLPHNFDFRYIYLAERRSNLFTTVGRAEQLTLLQLSGRTKVKLVHISWHTTINFVTAI